jgi:hypothetical protein
MTIDTLLPSIFQNFVSPVIALLFALAVLLFLWGIAEFIRDAGSEDGRTKGKQNMIWGIVGIFIMVSVFGIIRVIENTIGTNPNDRPNFPTNIDP